LLTEPVSTQLPQPGKLKVMEMVYKPAKFESLKSATQVLRGVPLPFRGSAGGIELVNTGEFVFARFGGS
jgi:hypothetical protein